MYDEKEVLLVANDLQEAISYDEWSAREYGETAVDFDWTARCLIDKGYHKLYIDIEGLSKKEQELIFEVYSAGYEAGYSGEAPLAQSFKDYIKALTNNRRQI